MKPRNRVFADANADFDSARYVLYGAPWDSTQCFRSGSRRAPEAMREASYNYETWLDAYRVDLAEVPVCDLGDLSPEEGEEPLFSDLQSTQQEIVGAGKIPILLGGEHSVSGPAARAMPKGVHAVVLDAHLDFRRDYQGTPNSHACTVRRITEHLGVERATVVGVRSGAREEYEDARRQRLAFLPAEECRDAEGLRRALDARTGDSPVYLSIDMDVFDPAYAPGVGNPEPFGLAPGLVRALVVHLAPRLAGLDITEVTPDHDQGVTALLGAKLVREFLGARESLPPAPPRKR
ncbi:MAG: agmatinase [Euryarchaeota archaeon]|nr:agmatinase [Euryarchaeota archaeon]